MIYVRWGYSNAQGMPLLSVVWSSSRSVQRSRRFRDTLPSLLSPMLQDVSDHLNVLVRAENRV